MDRKNHFDYLKVIATFSVILAHVCSTALGAFENSSMSSLNEEVYYGIYFVLRNITRYAVPVFLMITGALFLDKRKEITIDKLLKKYILKYTIVVIVFSWVFAMANMYVRTRQISLENILLSFQMMIENKSWEHMWYMYALIGVMLIIPLIKKFVCYSTEYEIRYIIIVSLIFVSLVPFLNSILSIKIGIQFPIASIYVVYVLIGYYISNKKSRLNNLKYLAILSLSMTIVAMSSMLSKLKGIDIEYIIHYSSPFIVMMSYSLFSIVCNIYDENPNIFKNNRFISIVSKNSLGIYIIHMGWVHVIYSVLDYNPFVYVPILNAIFLVIVVFILTFISVMIMKKIPYIKNML